MLNLIQAQRWLPALDKIPQGWVVGGWILGYRRGGFRVRSSALVGASCLGSSRRRRVNRRCRSVGRGMVGEIQTGFPGMALPRICVRQFLRHSCGVLTALVETESAVLDSFRRFLPTCLYVF